LRRDWEVAPFQKRRESNFSATSKAAAFDLADLDDGGFGRAANLRRHLDLDDVVLDGVNHQIANRVQTEFSLMLLR